MKCVIKVRSPGKKSLHNESTFYETYYATVYVYQDGGNGGLEVCRMHLKGGYISIESATEAARKFIANHTSFTIVEASPYKKGSHK
jgi:hypothetical protein